MRIKNRTMHSIAFNDEAYKILERERKNSRKSRSKTVCDIILAYKEMVEK